jgi:hypothetical protein
LIGKGGEMRSQDTILERFKQSRKTDVFGFECSEYLIYLDYVHAKPFLKDGVTEWATEDLSKVRDKIIDYLPFAWEKANSCRGLSANRSVMHFVAWVWLDENPLSEWLDRWEDNYEFYGKPILEKISEAYGFDWKSVDNGRRQNNED